MQTQEEEDTTLEDVRILTDMYPSDDARVMVMLQIINDARKRLRGFGEEEI